MKPQKRVRIEVAGFFRLGKGAILTYNEAADCYFDDKMSMKSYKRAWIEALQSPVVEWLSADGLTRKEFRNELYNNRGIFEKWNFGKWEERSSYNSDFIHHYRIKPQPKYIPVPECVKIVKVDDPNRNYAILNETRGLFISCNDGKPLMIGFLNYPNTPHQIDPTPIDKFEDGGIYFYTGGSKRRIGSYYVYSKKADMLYRFDGNNYCLDVSIPDQDIYLKVIPVK